jgi:hypothetical protein
MRLSHIGHHPIRSGGRLLQLRAELLLLRGVPALSMARPLVVECLLTNELLSNTAIVAPSVSKTVLPFPAARLLGAAARKEKSCASETLEKIVENVSRAPIFTTCATARRCSLAARERFLNFVRGHGDAYAGTLLLQ